MPDKEPTRGRRFSVHDVQPTSVPSFGTPLPGPTPPQRGSGPFQPPTSSQRSSTPQSPTRRPRSWRPNGYAPSVRSSSDRPESLTPSQRSPWPTQSPTDPGASKTPTGQTGGKRGRDTGDVDGVQANDDEDETRSTKRHDTDTSSTTQSGNRERRQPPEPTVSTTQSGDRERAQPPVPPESTARQLRTAFGGLTTGARAAAQRLLRGSQGRSALQAPRRPTSNRSSQRSGLSGLMAPGATPNQSSDFYPGQIITAPHNATALDPNANPLTDRNFVQGPIATISQKRRLMVVLLVHSQHIMAFPLYTHGHNGLRNVPSDILHEHVCLVDQYEENMPNLGPHAPLLVTELDRSIGEDSSLRITDVVTLDLKEAIRRKGRISKESAQRLQQLYQAEQQLAQQESWMNAPGE